MIDRNVDDLVFHRPIKRSSSAIRQGSYKLYLTWNQEGDIIDRQLYNLDESIDENEETDISEQNEEKTNYLQAILLDYLKSLN